MGGKAITSEDDRHLQRQMRSIRSYDSLSLRTYICFFTRSVPLGDPINEKGGPRLMCIQPGPARSLCCPPFRYIVGCMGVVLRATCATRRNPIAPPAVEPAGARSFNGQASCGFCC